MSPATKRGGKVDLDPIAARCETLKLTHAAECLAELVEEASRQGLSPLGFFDCVLTTEIERKLSCLPTGKTLEGFDWTFHCGSTAASSRRSRPAPSCASARTERIARINSPVVRYIRGDVTG